MGAVRATAADVARAAGVSRSTVSYILNGSRRNTFPAETVAKVEKAAAMLKYTPHGAARALRRGTSSVVLATMRSLPQSAALGSFLDALTASLAERGLSLVTWTAADQTSLSGVLADVSPDVIIELVPMSGADAAAATASGADIVSARAALSSMHAALAAAQVDHLAALGHRRIGIISVDESRVQGFADEWAERVRDAATSRGLPAPVDVALGGPSEATVVDLATALEGWTEGDAPVTALAAYNDQFAALALTAARRVGLEVPSQLSVMGVDDDPLARWLDPALTTVRPEMTTMAEMVAQQICERDGETPAATGDAQVTATVVVRGSTAQPASS